MKSTVPLLILLASSAFAQPAKVHYTVDPTKVENTIDVRIHGQFLEHIFNSVHGGLWGDLALNPSLETSRGGGWAIEDKTIKTTGPVTDSRLIFGDEKWGDYEITLDARKLAGAEGFIILFRVANERRFYWANMGGWGNREHAFEKSRGALGAHKAGTIQDNRWYRVRLRCEGPHYQVWLDDALVLDATDERNPILKGAVGLTGWGSQVQFRNIQVKGLDGKVLFEGLPPATAMATAPAYWKLFGEAQFANESTDPFSSSDCIRIRRTQNDGEAGIRQQPISLRKGERYVGSVYLKGKATALNARLVDSAGAVLHTVAVNDITADWKKHTVEFTAEEDRDATLELALAGAGDVCIDMVSLMPQSAIDAGGFRPDVLKAIQEQKPATIRYPGGCFASAYRWMDGVGPREKRKYYPNVIWDDQDPNQMGTDEFMDLCRRVGAEPVIAINMTAGVQEAIDWLEYCNGSADTPMGALRARNGHPQPYNVKYWEIDNETWGMGPDRYAEVVTRFSRALRQKDPSIQVIACGGYGYDDGKGSSNGWNQRLLDLAAKEFDYLSIHYYNGIMYAQDFVEDPRRYEAYMRDEIGAMIRKSANPKIRIYCSEWGMMNDQWRSGLYTGGILNGFERISELAPMSCPAVWLQTVSASRPDPRWRSCSILFDHRTTYPAPTYVVQKLWRDHFAPKRVRLEGPDRPLNSVATLSEDGKTLYLKMVNPTNQPVEVQLDTPFTPAKATLLQVAAPENARNSLAAPNALAPVPAPVKAAGTSATFTLSPFSASVLTIVKN